MDEAQIPDGPVEAAHGAGLLAVIALLVAACGLAMQAFLGGLGLASAEAGSGDEADPDRAPSAAAPAGALQAAGQDVSTGFVNVGPLQPDQQAAFLESIRLSGTGGWSSRTEIVGYGVSACRMLAQGVQPAQVVETLVADGEDRRQAEAVVPAAANTLCSA